MSNLRKIRLSTGKFALVDKDDYGFLKNINWSESKSLNTSYAIARVWIGNKWHSVTMHRMIMRFSKRWVDHIDGNGLNNQKSNLRYCNQNQNSANSKNKDRKAPYRGVTKTKYGRYHARITVSTKTRHLGMFDTAEAAAKAYDEAARQHWGDFATTNF